jgi:hypothetical protein
MVARGGDIDRRVYRSSRGNELGHGSPWKDLGRSGTWQHWITGRADRDRFWNEADCLEPEHDARVHQSRGRNLSFQGPVVRAGRYPDHRDLIDQRDHMVTERRVTKVLGMKGNELDHLSLRELNESN